MCTRRGRFTVRVLVLFASLAVSHAAGQKPLPQEPPAFRTAVDVIPVDVVVLDGKGVQVSDLQADAFNVTIDGRPRRIVSSRYVGYAAGQQQSASDKTPGSSTSPRVSTNQEPPGRLIMVVVDEAGMDFGGTRTAIEALKPFLARLAPGDAIGLSVLPFGGVAVPFTRQHAQIVETMTRVGGQLRPYQRMTGKEVGWAEALEYGRHSESVVWKDVIRRECSYCGNDGGCVRGCVSELEGEAAVMVAEIRERVAEFSGGMRDLLSYLRGFEGPKTIILLSSGLVADQFDGEIASLGREAAAAGCSIYALRFNAWDLPDASERKPSPSRFTDLQIQGASLDALAGRTRGWVFDLVASADAPLEKLSEELAGFYLLGIEPEASDRDGKSHPIRVEVKRKNVSVRARRELVWKARPSTPVSAADAVRTMLGSPVVANELPLRVTSYTAPAESGKLRVLIAAEVGRGSMAPQELTIGWALVAASGKVGTGGSEKVLLKQVAGRTTAPLSFVRTPLVDAGRYMLKLAVLDGEGRRGSVTHEVDARLRSAGPLAAGNLVIGTPPADAKTNFEPPVDCVIEGNRLFVYLPVMSREPQALARARATIEIARGEDQRPLLQSTVPLTGSRPDQRAVQVSVGTGLLPPGSYVARVLLAAGSVVATASREFLFAPAPSGAASEGTGPAGALAGGFAAPRFALSEILEPQAMAPFLDRAAKAGPDLPATVFSHARAGRYAAAVDSLPPDASGPVPPFLRGLALLERGDLEGAGKEFRESRRVSPEFVDAIVFLGVCFVAGGKVDDAVGALQTARFGLDDEPMVHHLLIDARLRRQQVEQAKALAEQATGRWPDDARFQLQLANVLAAAGEAPRALAVLDVYLATHTDDAQALFLALRLLYTSSVSSKGKAAAVVERFRDYAARYDAANGPERALVAEWLKYLTR